jgi:DNA-binding transcriptional LysR family regulator
MAYSNGALNAQARRVGNPEGVVDSRPRAAKDWSFFGPEGEIYVDVKSRLQINNGFGVRYAGLAGAGIVMQRAELVADGIAEGRLQPLLSNYTIQSRPRHIVWLENRRMTPKLRAFIDFVAEVYG